MHTYTNGPTKVAFDRLAAYPGTDLLGTAEYLSKVKKVVKGDSGGAYILTSGEIVGVQNAIIEDEHFTTALAIPVARAIPWIEQITLNFRS